MWKAALFGFVLFFLQAYSCKRPDKIEIDPITKEFILNRISEKPVTGKQAFFFIYSSFCGACTDSVMSIIRNNPIRSHKKYFICDSMDSIYYQLKNIYGAGTMMIDSRELERNGLGSAVNRIFLFNGSECIYANKITYENSWEIKHVFSELDNMLN